MTFAVTIGRNFYCRAGGNNRNSGTHGDASTPTQLPGLSADHTYIGGSWAGGSLTYTVASGDPSADGVTVGHWFSLTEPGGTEAVYVGQISAVTGTTITSAGGDNGTYTIPADGVYELRVGGAFEGPVDGLTSFPFAGFGWPANNSMIWLKNDQTYQSNQTTGIFYVRNTHVSGFGTVPGDDGRAVIQGATTGSAYTVIYTVSEGQCAHNLHVKNNGASGTANYGFRLGNQGVAYNCIAEGIFGYGFYKVGSGAELLAKDCTLDGYLGGDCSFVHCVASGNGRWGFWLSGDGSASHCVSMNNSNHGFHCYCNRASQLIESCISYGNAGDGVFVGNVNRCGAIITNSLLVNNGGHGIDISTGTRHLTTRMISNGFFGNTGGQVRSTPGGQCFEFGSQTLTENPFEDAAAYDWQLATDEAKAVGRRRWINPDFSVTTKTDVDLGIHDRAALGGSGSVNVFSQQVVR